MSTLREATSTTPLLASSNPLSPRPSASRTLSAPPLRIRRQSTPPIVIFPAILIFILLAFTTLIAWDVSSLGNCYFAPLCRILGDSKGSTDAVWWRNAGAYAPWRPLGSGGGHKGLPKGCEINQVTLVSPASDAILGFRCWTEIRQSCIDMLKDILHIGEGGVSVGRWIRSRKGR